MHYPFILVLPYIVPRYTYIVVHYYTHAHIHTQTQTDRQTDRQTDTHTHTHCSLRLLCMNRLSLPEQTTEINSYFTNDNEYVETLKSTI